MKFGNYFVRPSLATAEVAGHVLELEQKPSGTWTVLLTGTSPEEYWDGASFATGDAMEWPEGDLPTELEKAGRFLVTKRPKGDLPVKLEKVESLITE